MSTAGPWALSLDAIFELLCRRRRRYALYALYRNGNSGVRLDELASRIRRLRVTSTKAIPTRSGRFSGTGISRNWSRRTW
ncbi:hypothetical protein [Halalkalicoccus paucihalophilus]|uniref:hypothetical protein n=1 Tax=Halalkalicoccus paucihalophilus TaxID=1008153 RepID=UPI001B802869|nr:hypothetical protein [Halalkalicoccus paucihalophilus]